MGVVADKLTVVLSVISSSGMVEDIPFVKGHPGDILTSIAHFRNLQSANGWGADSKSDS